MLTRSSTWSKLAKAFEIEVGHEIEIGFFSNVVPIEDALKRFER